MTNRNPRAWSALRTSIAVVTLMSASGTLLVAQGQTPPPAQAEPATTGTSALRIEVVLSRVDAKGTRVSRVPYLFSLVPGTPGGSQCRLRMGAQVPLRSSGGEVSYRDIGTNIDCSVTPVSEGRFQVRISIDESSVIGEDMIEPSAAAKLANIPVFRTYQSTNAVVLRNGESGRFTTAVDRVTGETVVAEVTLTVLK